jgi:hypothetical protein
MLWTITKALISAAILVTVAEISRRFPRWGAMLLTLPLVSMLAFALSWTQYHDLPAVSKLAKETLILVPLTLLFFVPLAFAEQWELRFWTAFVLGLAVTLLVIACWMRLGPRIS